MATRGFSGRSRGTGEEQSGRLPPGQYLTTDFPVLSAGPTPHVAREDWRFTLQVGPRPIKSWSWADFIRLPITKVTPDIHCVTKWSKFDTTWEGVSIDDLLADAGLEPPTAIHAGAFVRWLLDQRADQGSAGRPRDDRDRVRRQAHRARAWRSRAPAGAAPVLLEIGEVGQGPAVHRARRSRVLGAAWLSHVRRSVARSSAIRETEPAGCRPAPRSCAGRPPP